MLNLYRRAVLGVAGMAPIERVARRHGFRLAARRFVAGEDATAALPVLRDLLGRGRLVIVDVLGEYVRDRSSAEAMAVAVGTTIDGLADAGIRPVISVKPTQLGLGLDPELAAELAGGLGRRAEATGGRVCLDMEDHRHVGPTLELLRRVRRDGAPATSTVLQA